MTVDDLWDIDNIKIDVMSPNCVNINYSKVYRYGNSKCIEVHLNIFDKIGGKTITEKVLNRVKILTAKLEKENEEIKKLIKWESDFKKSRQ